MNDESGTTPLHTVVTTHHVCSTLVTLSHLTTPILAQGPGCRYLRTSLILAMVLERQVASRENRSRMGIWGCDMGLGFSFLFLQLDHLTQPQFLHCSYVLGTSYTTPKPQNQHNHSASEVRSSLRISYTIQKKARASFLVSGVWPGASFTG